MTVGRPPCRPRAAAAASPATVLARIKSRSSWVTAARVWKTNTPPGVDVSNDSVRERNAIPRSLNLPTSPMRSGTDRPAESIEPPHGHDIALAGIVQQRSQLRPGRRRPRCAVRPDPITPRRYEGIKLQCRVLQVRRDAGVSELSHDAERTKPVALRSEDPDHQYRDFVQVSPVSDHRRQFSKSCARMLELLFARRHRTRQAAQPRLG